MVKYRIPTIDEFVQDFEFQYKATYGGGSLGYLDNITGKHVILHRVPKSYKWNTMKVWWLPRTREEATKTRTYDDGTSVTWIVHPFDKPFSIESMLEDNKIRVKL